MADNNDFQGHRLESKVTLKGVTFLVEYTYFPGHEGSEYEEPVDDDIDVDAVWIDEFDVTHMINEKYINLIVDELFKNLKEEFNG